MDSKWNWMWIKQSFVDLKTCQEHLSTRMEIDEAPQPEQVDISAAPPPLEWWHHQQPQPILLQEIRGKIGFTGGKISEAEPNIQADPALRFTGGLALLPTKIPAGSGLWVVDELLPLKLNGFQVDTAEKPFLTLCLVGEVPVILNLWVAFLQGCLRCPKIL